MLPITDVSKLNNEVFSTYKPIYKIIIQNNFPFCCETTGMSERNRFIPVY